MPAPIKITGPVGPNDPPPGIYLRFRKAEQVQFFKFRKIAAANFDTDATSLGKLLVLDFVREFAEFPNSTRVRRLVQEVLKLDKGEAK